jgi:hypothetical protein
MVNDLIAQVFSDRVRFDAARCCSCNGFLGLVLLGGAFVLRFAGPPDPLGTVGFAFVVASALLLIAALVVPLLRPRLVPKLLAAQGVLILALAFAFACACAAWAIAPAKTHHTFGYLPGLIAIGSTYGATLWADFGRPIARPRRFRLAGFVAGIVLELLVAALLVAALLRNG